jgi:hypothetical protein
MSPFRRLQGERQGAVEKVVQDGRRVHASMLEGGAVNLGGAASEPVWEAAAAAPWAETPDLSYNDRFFAVAGGFEN